MADRDITFKFDVGDKVITIFGDQGVVDWLGYSGHESQYSIKTRNGCAWYREDEVFDENKIENQSV